jgi:hypothetical protein
MGNLPYVKYTCTTLQVGYIEILHLEIHEVAAIGIGHLGPMVLPQTFADVSMKYHRIKRGVVGL